MHHKMEYYQAPDPRNYSWRAHLQVNKTDIVPFKSEI